MIMVTPLYAGLLVLLFIGLSLRVIRSRRGREISLGDGGNPAMLRVIRGHANFVEYVPLALLLMLILEISRFSIYVLHALGILLVVGRLLHGYALSFAEHPNSDAQRGRHSRLSYCWSKPCCACTRHFLRTAYGSESSRYLRDRLRWDPEHGFFEARVARPFPDPDAQQRAIEIRARNTPDLRAINPNDSTCYRHIVDQDLRAFLQFRQGGQDSAKLPQARLQRYPLFGSQRFFKPRQHRGHDLVSGQFAQCLQRDARGLISLQYRFTVIGLRRQVHRGDGDFEDGVGAYSRAVEH